MGNETSQGVRYADAIENDISVSFDRCPHTEQEGTGGGGGSPAADPALCREGHVACSSGNRLYVFGGVVQTPDGLSQESDDLLVFDIENLKWTKLEVKGQRPLARSMATMSACGDKLYLFGGLSQEAGWFDTMHVFDTKTNVWSDVNASGTAPSARDKMASAVIGNDIYIFGGFGPKSAEDEVGGSTGEEDEEWEDEGLAEEQEGAEFGWFNDLFVFDTEKNEWRNPLQMNLGGPTARAAHAMVSIGQDLLIFGGRDMDSRRNDLHIFNTASRKWRVELKPTGQQPEPRSFHAAVAVDTRLVVLGGRGIVNQHFADCHIFDTESSEWLQPSLAGDVPTGRSMHTATLVHDQILIFGGSSEFDQATNQCQKYHSDLFTVKSACIKNGKSIPKQGGGDNLEKAKQADVRNGQDENNSNVLNQMTTGGITNGHV